MAGRNAFGNIVLEITIEIGHGNLDDSVAFEARTQGGCKIPLFLTIDYTLPRAFEMSTHFFTFIDGWILQVRLDFPIRTDVIHFLFGSRLCFVGSGFG